MSDKTESTEQNTVPEQEEVRSAAEQSDGASAVATPEEGDDKGAAPAPDELLQELDAARDSVLRTQAEMQNLRRRVERDIQNAHKFALERFVGDLLPVVDNLERALAAFDDTDDQHTVALVEGVELTLKNFLDVLQRYQVEPIDPRGKPFDPDLHQAMSMVPTGEVEPNTVVDVFQKGYQLNGRLVRPAMVVVAKAP